MTTQSNLLTLSLTLPLSHSILLKGHGMKVTQPAQLGLREGVQALQAEVQAEVNRSSEHATEAAPRETITKLEEETLVQELEVSDVPSSYVVSGLTSGPYKHLMGTYEKTSGWCFDEHNKRPYVVYEKKFSCEKEAGLLVPPLGMQGGLLNYHCFSAVRPHPLSSHHATTPSNHPSPPLPH